MTAQVKAAPRKGTGAKKRKKAEAKGKDELRVRMYRVGFGDFFLLTVPSDDGPQHILIDCGVTKGTSGQGDIGTIKAAVRHMAQETNHTLALIIVTHRHQDHIVGFSRCEEVFRKFDVGAIWMSHWETEYDEEVMKFQAEMTALAVDVHQHLALRGAPDATVAQMMGMLANAVGPEEGPGGGSNAKSLALLRKELGVKPSYLHRGQKAKLPKELVKAGLEAEILGPPPPDALAFMKLKDLKKGVGQFLGAAGGGIVEAEHASPFGKDWLGGPDDYPVSAFREWAPRIKDGKPGPPQRHAARVEAAIAAAQPEMLLTAAKTLDGFLNNQSLVVLFTWKGKKLLFAGDAQAGNWEYWLYDLEKPSKAGVETLTPSSASILGGIDFYKVGHHGSTNSTPIAAVAAMGEGFAAMCSTEADTFGSADRESEVPRIPLIGALNKKCECVVRSDHYPFELEDKKVKAVKGAPDKLPQPKRGGRYEVGPGFVDFLV
jgi:beta-lactamase superfamily II metal-dependent hydrolase